MKLTADTITEEQIRELWNNKETRKIFPHAGEVMNRREFRARCAEILNVMREVMREQSER